jgi:hypothetical protein
MLKRTDRRPLLAHVWTKDPHGFYIEPEWCSRRLFEVERFDGVIKDPACGIGRITDAARTAGYSVIATDLVDRGYPQFDGVEDFLRSERRVDNIVCNPPYHICRAFAEHALKLAHVILAGEKPGGGKQDFVWLTFSHGHQGPPKLHWLCRESPPSTTWVKSRK